MVEAGPGPSDPKVAAQITDAVRMPIGAASSVVRHYATTLTDEPSRVGHIMRGAVVGGSGAVNGGYFCRALPEDFDSWALPGWSWADVLPHFRAIENDLDFVGPLHGSDGPILVRRVSEFDGCTASFVDAGNRDWISVGGGSQRCRRGATVADGSRRRAAEHQWRQQDRAGGAFLQPALGRPNVTLMADTRVVRITVRRRSGGGRGLRRPGWARST